MGDDNASTITALCTGAGAQFLAAGETFVGPTTAGMDFQYLAATFADGILAGFTSVSVHPYRSSIPETALPDWASVWITEYNLLYNAGKVRLASSVVAQQPCRERPSHSLALSRPRSPTCRPLARGRTASTSRPRRCCC